MSSFVFCFIPFCFPNSSGDGIQGPAQSKQTVLLSYSTSQRRKDREMLDPEQSSCWLVLLPMAGDASGAFPWLPQISICYSESEPHKSQKG